jgi:type IV pilus assembly protein PilQ
MLRVCVGRRGPLVPFVKKTQESPFPHLDRRSLARWVACCTVLCTVALAIGAEEPPVLKKVETVGGPAEGQTATATGGLITLEVNERPLKQVLDYLSTFSNHNIRVVKDKDNRLLVTFKLENVTYRAILDFIARKYGMVVDDSQLSKNNIIYLDTPEKVSMVFNNADIRDVINTIAIQSNANIVIGPEVTGQVSMRLENVPWNDALNIVVKTLDFVAVPEVNNTIRITSPAKIAAQTDIRIFRLAYISPEGSKYTAVLTSEFARREESKEQQAAGSSLIDVLNKIKSSQGQITFEKRSNALVVRDTATTLDQMQTIIDKLDQPPKQVHVAVKLVELSDSDSENLGVSWANGLRFGFSPLSSWSTAFPFDVSHGVSNSLLGTLSTGLASRPAIDPITNTLTSAPDLFTLSKASKLGGSITPNAVGLPANLGLPTAISPITLGTMGFLNTNAVFEMIRTKTSGRVIESPQLIALDNEEATIQVGELVRYAETFVANTEGGGNVSGFREASGSPIKLGTQLLIIPHVTGPENNVLMTVIPKVEQFSTARSGVNGAPPGFQRFNGVGISLDLPETAQRIVVTKMMLRNGETGVIGGLRENTDATSETKVPVFGELPIIGRLFRHRSSSNQATNLLVFVTPTIVDFHEADTFKKDLDRLRQDYAKPFTPLGEDSIGSDETASRNP